MKMKTTIVFVIMMMTINIGMGQNNPDIKRTMHWYFGNGAGLDFSSGSPVVDTSGKTNTGEATVTMSDTCGELLFYAQEDTIFNSKHQMMDNGKIKGGYTITQMVCLPQPGNDSIYYLFYNFCGGTLTGQFLFSKINIFKNQGLGKVLDKDIVLIDSFATEKVAAIHHCNGKDFWIISKPSGKREQIGQIPDGNKIFAWLLTESGLNQSPVTSTPSDLLFENGDGVIRFTSDGQRAAFAFVYPDMMYYRDSSFIELYDFDNCTGIFSNPIRIPYPQPYGLCFSPDNTKLYALPADAIWFSQGMENLYVQFDLSIYNQAAIIASKTILHYGVTMGTFQIGVDGKIYVSDWDTLATDNGKYNLSVISNPNEAGTSCNLLFDEIYLEGKSTITSIPYWPDSYFRSFEYKLCSNSIKNKDINEDKITVYPNPCMDYLIIRSELLQGAIIEIRDLIGNLILKTKASNETETVDVRNLSYGIYRLKINISDKQITNLIFSKL